MKRFAAACLLVVLAGCSQPSSQPAGDGPPTEITDPRDYSYLNSTPGSHVHNYWGGRDQLTLLDLDFPDHNSQTGEARVVAGDFRPPEGSIVPQGTGSLDVTAHWTLGEGLPTRTNHFQRMELWAKSALDSSTHLVGPIENGQTLRINSTNDQDDPPHYVLSLWRFMLLAANDDGGDTVYAGNASMQVVVHRSLPLPVFPPHPDAWNGAAELGLGHQGMDVDYSLQALFLGSCNGCLPIFRPQSNSTVPMDASELAVTLTTSPPVQLELYYHGADTWNFTMLPSSGPAQEVREYRIPVDGRGDSPYAKQSLWEFAISCNNPAPVCAWSGHLELDLKAVR